MSAENSFWQILMNLGREHDRQLNGLLSLLREVRLELEQATSREEILLLRSENLELKKQLSLSLLDHPLPELPHISSKHDEQLPVSPMKPSTQLALPARQRSQLDSNSMPTASTAQKSTDNNAAFVVTCNAPEVSQAAPMPDPVVVVASADSLDKKTSIGGAAERPKGMLDQHLAFITTNWFERSVAFLIMLNTITMMVEAQFLGMQAGYIGGIPEVDVSVEVTYPWAVQAFFITDRMFTAIFFVELLLRILKFQMEFFKAPLNWIDILAVLGSILQAFLEGDWMNPTVVRLLRVSRPVRSIRFLKNKQIQKSLNILIKCLQASLVTLFWSLCLLLMIQCMIGMVAGQIAQEYISDLNNPEKGREEVFRYYGTFTKCLVTMFEIHMANWAAPCRVVLNNVGEFWGNALVSYRCVMGYALMSVLGAVFVQQAMSVQQQDHELMILKRQKETDRYTKKLKTLFGKMDTDGDGQLSRGEFDAVSDDMELKHFMESIDINADDLNGLFSMLDTGDGFVSFDEFLMGATRVRGDARNIDVAQLMVTVARMEHMMESKMAKMANMIEKIDELGGLLREQSKSSEVQKESSWRLLGTQGTAG